MKIIHILLGVSLLVMGRKLFWLFVGAVGFIAGFSLAGQALQSAPDTTILVIALIAGIAGALLAFFVQQAALGVAGFLAGAYVAINALKYLNWEAAPPVWLFALLGGLIGALLLLVLFDWALTILSSLIGAFLIVQTVHANLLVDGIFFLALFAAGIVVQRRIKEVS